MNKMGKWRPKGDRGPACGDVGGLETKGNYLRDPSNPKAPHVITSKSRTRDGKGPA